MGEVGDYVASLDDAHREVVAHLYDRARELVPDVEEGKSYGMPALRYRGSPLLSIQATKTHVGLYPFSPAVIEAVADALGGFTVTKGSIGFQSEAPVPDDVLDRIVLARRGEIDAAKDRRR